MKENYFSRRIKLGVRFEKRVPPPLQQTAHVCARRALMY